MLEKGSGFSLKCPAVHWPNSSNTKPMQTSLPIFKSYNFLLVFLVVK